MYGTQRRNAIVWVPEISTADQYNLIISAQIEYIWNFPILAMISNKTDELRMTLWTLLHKAAIDGHKDVVQLLLDRGGDPDERNTIGSTSLHWAAKHGHQHVVQLLLDRGADPHTVNGYGRTVLQEAEGQFHEDAIHLLIDRGPIP